MCFGGSKNNSNVQALPAPAPIAANDPIPEAKIAATKDATTTASDTRTTSGSTGLNIPMA